MNVTDVTRHTTKTTVIPGLAPSALVPRKLIAMAVFAVFLASMPGVALAASEKSQPAGESPGAAAMREMAVMGEMMQGERLTPVEVKELETKLAANPNDLSIRNQLIGYYVQGQFTSKSSRQAHQNHILWLIEHHPEAPVLASPLYGDLNSVLDGSAYEKAKDLWMKQVANHPKDAVFAGKAARFCLMEDSETAEKLLKQAKVLDPKNPKWREDLAELYQLKAMDSKPGVGNSAARKALMELEKARDLTRDESEKSQFLPDLAKMAFASGDLVKARKYASDLLQKKDGNEGLRDDDSGIHFGNLILGRIALSEGKIAEAKKHLLDAARITSSQTLQITGPNMALAAELLEKGEKQTVLEYLQLCGKFWRTGAGKLARWKKEIEAGVSPQFDASQLN